MIEREKERKTGEGRKRENDNKAGDERAEGNEIEIYIQQKSNQKKGFLFDSAHLSTCSHT